VTYKEAFYAVAAMSYDQTVLASRETTSDRVLKKVARWRLREHDEYEAIRALLKVPERITQVGCYRQFGKPKVSIVAVRERALRETPL